MMIEIGIVAGGLRSLLGYIKRSKEGERFNGEKFAATVIVYMLAWVLVQQGLSTYNLDQTIQLLTAVGVGELVREAVSIVSKYLK